MTVNLSQEDIEKLVLTEEERQKIRIVTQNKISQFCNSCEGNFNQADIDAMYDDGERAADELQVSKVLSSPILSAYIDKQVKEAAKEIEEEYRAYAKEWAILGSLEIIDQKVKEAREQAFKEIGFLIVNTNSNAEAMVAITNHVTQALKGQSLKGQGE